MVPAVHEKPLLLPVRPSPIVGEAPISYLGRVAEANGHETIRQLWCVFGGWDNLIAALGLGVADAGTLCGYLPGYLGGSDELTRGINVSDFNHAYLRWCPLCLMDSPHLRGIWLLKLCCVCTTHKILLQEQCSNCGNRQTLHRPNVGWCECGTRLTCGTLKTAPPQLIAVTEAMEQAIAGKTGGSKGLPPLISHQWLKLAIYLGQYTQEEQPAKPGQMANLHQLETALGLMGNLTQLLSCWPDNFQLMLKAIHQRNDGQTGLRKAFGPLLNVLYRQLHEPAFQFLRDAFEHYLQHHWEGLLCHRHRLFRQETIAVHPQLTIKQAAKLAGSSPSLVRQLLQAELVPGYQRKTPNKRNISAINRHQVRRIAELVKSSLTLEMAAKSLHLPERRLRLLISEGMIKPLVSRKQLKATSWRIPAKAIKQFWFKPEISKDSEARKISIAAILKHWRLSDKEFIALVTALMNAELKPISDSKDSVPLGKAILYKAQFQNWLRQLRGEELPAYSVDQVAKCLNIKQEVAYSLVKKGLLKATLMPGKGYRISFVQLAEFQNAYVSLAQLAKSVGISPRKLLNQIKAKPVTGLGIDGTRQYFYRIKDITAEFSLNAFN